MRPLPFQGAQRGQGTCPAPPPPPTAEQKMIASLHRQIASLESVINTLRRELAESGSELAPTQPGTAPAAPAPETWRFPAAGGEIPVIWVN